MTIPSKSKEIREYILEKVAHYPKHISKMVQEKFDLSKQGAYYHLKKLVDEQILEATGLRQNKTYKENPKETWQQVFDIDGLSEHLIWDMVQDSQILPDLDQDKAAYTLMYGFTEMLNNAIDHSEGEKVLVTVEVFHSKIRVIIQDNGIGIFKKIQREEGLDDERQAILLLSKGKYTSMPEHHSGQGIFFTSKAFDFFDIISGEVCFIHEKEGHNDWVLDNENQYKNGTTVMMALGTNSKLNMEDLFADYTSNDGEFGFDTTLVPVRKLQTSNEDVVSRSQAKRLMVGLHKFDYVRLDFDGINRIGQAFADEVFRVWKNKNPNTKLITTGENEAINKMIRRVEDSR